MIQSGFTHLISYCSSFLKKRKLEKTSRSKLSMSCGFVMLNKILQLQTKNGRASFERHEVSPLASTFLPWNSVWQLSQNKELQLNYEIRLWPILKYTHKNYTSFKRSFCSFKSQGETKSRILSINATQMN